MATYIYRCDCMDGEVEVTQPMSEDAFTSCLQVYERLGRPVPEDCRRQNGCRAERLISQTAGVVISGAPKGSCSIGEKAAGCGSCCSPADGGQGHCPFG